MFVSSKPSQSSHLGPNVHHILAYSHIMCFCTLRTNTSNLGSNQPWFRQWFRLAWLIQFFSGLMAMLLPSEAMTGGNATCHLWLWERHTFRSLHACRIQCFSGVMAMLLPLETTDMDDATSHLFMRECYIYTQISAGGGSCSAFPEWWQCCCCWK